MPTKDIDRKGQNRTIQREPGQGARKATINIKGQGPSVAQQRANPAQTRFNPRHQQNAISEALGEDVGQNAIDQKRYQVLLGPEDKGTRHGFDTVLRERATGKIIIIEHKGEGSPLSKAQRDPEKWIKSVNEGTINRRGNYARSTDKEIAVSKDVDRAMRSGRVEYRLMRTKAGANGQVHTEIEKQVDVFQHEPTQGGPVHKSVMDPVARISTTSTTRARLSSSAATERATHLQGGASGNRGDTGESAAVPVGKSISVRKTQSARDATVSGEKAIPSAATSKERGTSSEVDAGARLDPKIQKLRALAPRQASNAETPPSKSESQSTSRTVSAKGASGAKGISVACAKGSGPANSSRNPSGPARGTPPPSVIR